MMLLSVTAGASRPSTSTVPPIEAPRYILPSLRSLAFRAPPQTLDRDVDASRERLTPERVAGPVDDATPTARSDQRPAILDR